MTDDSMGIVINGPEGQDPNGDAAFLKDCMDNSVLAGADDAFMKHMNERGLPVQRSIAAAIAMAAAVAGQNPSVSFGVACQAMLQYFVSIKDKEMVCYIIALTFAMKSLPEGPASLLLGEVEIRAAIKKGEAIPESIRKQFGLADDTTAQDHMILREGNVVDASSIFASKKGTVH